MLKFDDLAKVLGGVAAGVAAATLYTHLATNKSVVQSVAGIVVHPNTDDHWMALVRHSLYFFRQQPLYAMHLAGTNGISMPARTRPILSPDVACAARLCVILCAHITSFVVDMKRKRGGWF
jgi:hypothetical protein